MSRSWSLGLCLATFLAPAAFGQQASTSAQPQEAPRQLDGVDVDVEMVARDFQINMLKESWKKAIRAANAAIANQEAELARLRAELARVPAYPVDPNILD